MYKRNDLSLFLLEVWAKSAQTAQFGRIWNSRSSERKKEFWNLFFWVRTSLPRGLIGLLTKIAIARFWPFLKISSWANFDILDS